MRQKPCHPHKKTRGQRIGQPLDDQKDSEPCEQVVHQVNCRRLPAASEPVSALAPEPAYYSDPLWAPDGKHIAFKDNRLNTWILNLATGKLSAAGPADEFGGFANGSRGMAWSPDGQWFVYARVSGNHFPVLMLHDVATGKRRLLASFRGSNSAPAWSPDGRQVVATLSISGNAQIYGMDANGGEPRRLSNSSSIDTEPVFSADGKAIFFVSDRGGSPQIYRMDAAGGGAQRLTFNGNYNISPAPSPDGRWLAYISRIGGAFRLHVMDLASGQVTAVTDSSADESPSFSPNSRLIIYATRDKGQEALMTTTVDGRIKTRLAGSQGDIREPEWGPFLK